MWGSLAAGVSPRPRPPLLHGDHAEARVKPVKIERVACDNSIARCLRAYDHVGIDNIRRAGLREQCANGLGMRPIQWDHLRSIELDHTPKAYLLGRVPDDLRESGRRNDDAVAVL